MAGKKPQSQGWDNIEWVTVNLSNEAKAQLKKWDVKYEATIDCLDKLVNDGFKLSVWCDARNHSIGCSLTTPKPVGVGKQKCLSARGPSMLDALRCIVFKHSVVLDADWTRVDANDSAESQWA